MRENERERESEREKCVVLRAYVRVCACVGACVFASVGVAVCGSAGTGVRCTVYCISVVQFNTAFYPIVHQRRSAREMATILRAMGITGSFVFVC